MGGRKARPLLPSPFCGSLLDIRNSRLLDVRMVLLQGLNPTASATKGGDALGGSDCRRYGREVGYLVFDGGLTDVGIVNLAQFSRRRVDDQVDFLVLDGVDDVRSPFMQFVDALRVNA